jgi:violaxanthin de-epoxidase
MRIVAGLFVLWLASTGAFAPAQHNFIARSSQASSASPYITSLAAQKPQECIDEKSRKNPLQNWDHAIKSAFMALGISLAAVSSPLPAIASDSGAIVSCLFTKCQLPLAKCITNPKCLANVVCINTCNGRTDEIECQIKCGDIFDNEVIGEFNKCAVADMNCVPQQADAGLYPVPEPSKLVEKFDTKLWNGKWYITAGQNPLFDIFPCQVHFFEETSKGTFYGKLNWRVEEPDGEFFTRDAIQQFVQDPKEPAHLLNHDNEYLHYKDDWYIVDFEYDNNKDGVPPFAFVYYRGSNDAWDGYGGVVVYTRDAAMPPSLIPRLRLAAEKVGFDFDKDFALTDNTCKVMDKGEALLLREKFAGKVALQTEEQIATQATKLRGNVVNGVKAQKIFFGNEIGEAEKAFERLEKSLIEFERDLVKGSD